MTNKIIEGVCPECGSTITSQNFSRIFCKDCGSEFFKVHDEKFLGYRKISGGEYGPLLPATPAEEQKGEVEIVVDDDKYETWFKDFMNKVGNLELEGSRYKQMGEDIDAWAGVRGVLMWSIPRLLKICYANPQPEQGTESGK